MYTGHRQPTPTVGDSTRPYLTLTFAQSLDAKIAGPGGKQLALSGRESLTMTHWGRYHCPRPIILDSQLRLSPDCKLLKNYRAGTGRRPWVVCIGYEKKTEAQEKESNQKKQALRLAGARVVDETGSKGLISLPMLMMSLSSMGIRSVMVEGGARVIQSFLAEAESSDIVDTVVVTVAPTLVGESGVGYGQNLVGNKLPKLQHISTEVFGSDAVIALKVVESTELSGPVIVLPEHKITKV
ncbi:predicted protein [Postia placenta Mad-698-R]|nr:predicted protein [Postia placenta Mad-698-R]